MRHRDQVDPFRILTANWTERFFARPTLEVAALAITILLRRLASRGTGARALSRPAAVCARTS